MGVCIHAGGCCVRMQGLVCNPGQHQRLAFAMMLVRQVNGFACLQLLW